MDDLAYFAGQALPVLLTAHLSRELPVQQVDSFDLERAAWKIAQNMVKARSLVEGL